MDGVDVGDFRGADDGGDIQIALSRARRPDADGLVGKANVQRMAVGFAVDSNGADTEFFAGADDAQRDFATIGDEDFTKHSFRSMLSNHLNCLACADGKERLAVLDRLSTLDKALDDFAGGIAF